MCNGESMGLLAGINARRSCRAFKDTPLSPALLKSVFEYATFAPSAKNTQPWEAYVVSGKKLDDLRAPMHDDLRNGRTAQVGKGSGDTEERKKRSRELSVEMTPFIQRQGWEAGSFVERSVRFFDAPCAVIVCMDEPEGKYHALDVGMFVQTL
ncbi:MAG: nitroreductase family protein, partial [Pyramidobacter sp.]|nr:nitroreductase family protein [Pyramidobacter sp.]